MIYLDRPVLEKAAEIYAFLKQRGKIPGEFDILIAATAISHELFLATNNERHYRALEEYFSLEIQNWNS